MGFFRRLELVEDKMEELKGAMTSRCIFNILQPGAEDVGGVQRCERLYLKSVSIAHPIVGMQQSTLNAPESLKQYLSAIILSPIRTLVPPWSWKAAACSATVRAIAFFATNLQSGHAAATKAMLVEAIYAVFAGGLIGAVSQQLRRAKPIWATALFICFGLPSAMTFAQVAVHRLAGTPHQSGGLILSLSFAALAASYSWYAMRRGAMLGGIDATTVWHDLQSLPRITLDFVLFAPRQLTSRLKW